MQSLPINATRVSRLTNVEKENFGAIVAEIVESLSGENTGNPFDYTWNQKIERDKHGYYFATLVRPDGFEDSFLTIEAIKCNECRTLNAFGDSVTHCQGCQKTELLPY